MSAPLVARLGALLVASSALVGVPALAKPGAKAQVAPKLDIKSWTLANGLQVLFLADHKAPIATVQVFYHVGSKDEHVGIRGVAHMFEHMMFKGSEHVPPEQHARLLKDVGGQTNAFTTEDLTAYHDTVPPSYVGFAMQLEAERMRHLKLFPETIDSERKVVEEEKRLRIDNNPIGKAIERFRLLAYTKHPYAWTAIGTIEDLEKVRPEDCQKFYDAYYQPNNATLIVVGDVGEAEARKLAEQHFGPVPRGPAPPRTKVEEPAQTALRKDTLTLEVQVPVVVGGYHVPRAADPDVPALEVLASALSAGESSRLHQRLVRQDRLAIAAGGLIEPMEDAGLFITYAAYLPASDPGKVQRALLEEVARVRERAISPVELDKAKNQLAAAFIFGLQTVDGVATDLGQHQYVRGDWRDFAKGASRYLAVTAADVTRVARKYLVDTNLTLLTLEPTAGGASAPSKGGEKPREAGQPSDAGAGNGKGKGADGP
ncbi:MAG TPA: pitrilysin family protein [Polyangia bacterium]|nr:pitrilysin family protein [Polyangia bacterium]